MNNLPSDTQENGQKVHHIKLGATFLRRLHPEKRHLNSGRMTETIKKATSLR